MSCSRAVFFPCFFQGYSGPGTLSLLFWLKCLEQKEQGKSSGNISEERKKEFWEFPPDRSFLYQILFPWLWSQDPWPGSLFGQEKGTSSQGMIFSWRNSLKALVGKDGGKKGWEVPFPSARNGAGTGTSQPCPSAIVSLSCQGHRWLEFSDHRNTLKLSQK